MRMKQKFFDHQTMKHHNFPSPFPRSYVFRRAPLEQDSSLLRWKHKTWNFVISFPLTFVIICEVVTRYRRETSGVIRRLMSEVDEFLLIRAFEIFPSGEYIRCDVRWKYLKWVGWWRMGSFDIVQENTTECYNWFGIRTLADLADLIGNFSLKLVMEYVPHITTMFEINWISRELLNCTS